LDASREWQKVVSIYDGLPQASFVRSFLTQLFLLDEGFLQIGCAIRNFENRSPSDIRRRLIGISPDRNAITLQGPASLTRRCSIKICSRLGNSRAVFALQKDGRDVGRRETRRAEALRRDAERACDQQEIASLRNQLAELDRKWNTELVTHSLKTRQRIADHLRRLGLKQGRQARLAVQSDINANMAKLEEMFPNVFPVWKKLFENARIEYEQRPIGSLSVR